MGLWHGKVAEAGYARIRRTLAQVELTPHDDTPSHTPTQKQDPRSRKPCILETKQTLNGTQDSKPKDPQPNAQTHIHNLAFSLREI